MQAQPEVGAADDLRIVLGLQPSRTQLNPPRRQAGEPALERAAPRAVPRHEDHQIGESASVPRPLPSADALFEPRYGLDHEIEVLVLGPARRADDEACRAAMD